jgi:DNA-binding NtrC family response regulator
VNPAAAFPANPVLIVDDEARSLRSIGLSLRMAGITHVETCNDSREVAGLLASRLFDVMLLDLTMPHVSGEEILSMAGEKYPEMPVIIITAMDEVDTAVRCMRKGAFGYLVKPVETGRLVSDVRRAVELRELKDQARRLKHHLLSGELENPAAFSSIVTRNKTMHSIFQYIESISASRQPILVTGETGVGKELVVRAIHALTAPRTPLVSVNVAGLDDNVFSDTLFGHVKGAFTGAEDRRQGLVEKAAGGILHLDEIGDLRHESQVKLLRLLQEGDYFPLGSDLPKRADIRVIASTNQDISGDESSEKFRKDLYYRLMVHHIHIPPLRERPDDILLLLSHFIDDAAKAIDRKPPGFSPDLPAALCRYRFPGNVRELKTLVHDAVSRSRSGRLALTDFNIKVTHEDKHRSGLSRIPVLDEWRSKEDPDRLPTIEEATVYLIRQALKQCDDNQSAAARMLGITRQRLARNLNKSG